MPDHLARNNHRMAASSKKEVQRSKRASTAYWRTSRLLGTELEVVAEVDLQPLLDAFQSRVEVIRNSLDDGRYTLWLELTETDGTVEDAVRQYTTLVEALPSHVRTLWDGALYKCLNTGVQAGYTPHAFPVGLSTNEMTLVARVGLRYAFTIYAPEERTGGPRKTKR